MPWVSEAATSTPFPGAFVKAGEQHALPPRPTIAIGFSFNEDLSSPRGTESKKSSRNSISKAKYLRLLQISQSHPRENGGRGCLKKWIPAFEGMTSLDFCKKFFRIIFLAF
jgi:hypothetical protein